IGKTGSGSTLYILDEPTTGLHMADVEKLIAVMKELVAQGSTVLVIEHNMDVILASDWIIDLGPEGGEKGGKIVCAGPPARIAKSKTSHTAMYVKRALGLKK
ncbi:hypothetical protein ACFLU6_13930, partial [Acidobacteriota bacterium]